jgi:predicted SAM-dependent methyltransferase
MMLRRLHLGCGKKVIPGWINIDAVPQASDVCVDDVSILNTIDDASSDEIYACHILEHFGRNEVNSVLETWFRKLKPGGVIRVSVPNIESVFEKYQQGTPLSSLLGLLYGGQRNEYDYHKIGFDFDSLSSMMSSVGFINIKKYEWQRLEHSIIDDYSQAYLPHMDKENGTLMSLNVEARRPE